jgi:hypothetical protein
MPKRRKPSVDEELQSAFGESLLQELTAAYVAWRQANAGKGCRAAEVGQALLYFLGGALAEMGVVARFPATGQWEAFVRDSQGRLAEAMAYCRKQLERGG